MSASVISDRANLGTLLAYTFSNQGWGSFMGSLVTIIVLAAYKVGKGRLVKLMGVRILFWGRLIGSIELIAIFIQPKYSPPAQRIRRRRLSSNRQRGRDHHRFSVQFVKQRHRHTRGLMECVAISILSR